MSIQEGERYRHAGPALPAPRRSSLGALRGFARVAYHFCIAVALTACGGGTPDDTDGPQCHSSRAGGQRCSVTAGQRVERGALAALAGAELGA